MAKQTSLFGKISGKLGAVVFATSGGETISREYNPNVANPSTQAQVDQRARLKLMSQLSASLAPVIAMQKDGLVSPRNQFVKKNFGSSYASDGIAQVTYENLQLTNGNAGLPSIVATRNQESGVTIQLAESALNSVSRVIYIMYRKTTENTLQLVQSVIAEAAGPNGTFPASMVYAEGDLVFYAYGMLDLNANATAQYGNIQVASAVDVAKLIATRKVDSSSYQFTQTRGATMFADEQEITDVPEGYARVYVTAIGGGTVTGAGVYEIGTTVQVAAITPNGYEFVGWKVNGSNEIISTDTPYSFTLDGMTDLVAVFERNTSAVNYTVTVRLNQVGQQAGAQVSGGGSYPAGDSVTVVCTQPQGDYTFQGWYIGSQRVSTNLSYTFVPVGDTIITAGWEQSGL